MHKATTIERPRSGEARSRNGTLLTSVRPVKTPIISRGEALPALDFFAGSGLVTEALKPYFKVEWANDISEKKASVYCANHPVETFRLCPIEQVSGHELPDAVLSWASFPCQDLSLAGSLGGIQSSRSGLVWQWLRVMDEMQSMPPLLVAENVAGLVSAHGGAHYRALHRALVERDYLVGALLMDALLWLPQSRPRVFVVAARKGTDVQGLAVADPTWLHSRAVRTAAKGLPNWIWWHIPRPPKRSAALQDIADFEAPCDENGRSTHVLSLIPGRHRKLMEVALGSGQKVFPGYRRIRNGKQVLELRFDGVSGCLRTPNGGSSRQVIVIWKNGHPETRLLTTDEAAALMGVRKSYKFPGTYNDRYRAIGDAVAVPVARHLARHLLRPLAERCR